MRNKIDLKKYLFFKQKKMSTKKTYNDTYRLFSNGKRVSTGKVLDKDMSILQVYPCKVVNGEAQYQTFGTIVEWQRSFEKELGRNIDYIIEYGDKGESWRTERISDRAPLQKIYRRSK